MTELEDDRRCFLCFTKEEISLCELCQLVYYCPGHIQFHKASSQTKCCPIKVETFPLTGRGYVAMSDIPAGTIIFLTVPAAMGPCVRTPLQCVTCFKQLSVKRTCSKCLLPVCDIKCERGSMHLPECGIYKKLREKMKSTSKSGEKQYREAVPSLTSAVTTVRLNSLKWRHPDCWSLLISLMAHEVNPILWADLETAFTSALHLDPRFELSELKQVFGIQCTNGANLHFPDGFGRGMGVYPLFAILNHSCMCNTETLEYKEHHTVMLRARFDIKKGEEVTTSYLKPNQATFARRFLLHEKWHFWCVCKRCADPTEMGSYLGGLKCQEKKCGNVVLSHDPLDQESDWVCTECQAVLSFEAAGDLLQNAVQDLEDLTNTSSIEKLEDTLFKLSQYLYPTHYIIAQVEMKLFFAYKDACGIKLPRPHLERKIQVCQNLIEHFEKSDPGERRERKVVEVELVNTRLLTVMQDYKAGIVSRDTYQAILLKKKELMSTPA